MPRKMLWPSKAIVQSLSVLLLVTPILTHSAFAADPGTPKAPASHHKARKKVEPLVLPPLPAGPLAQIPMDQLPAAAPKVTYENGMLAITAQNATLGEILRNVHQLTGATIDVPPAGANERVIVQLGPGAPRDVLAALLNGTSFNYVMLGSASDPKSVSSVLLTSRSGGEVQTAVNTAPAVDAPNPFQQQSPMPGHPMPPNFRAGLTSPPQPVVADPDADDSDADDKDDDSDPPAPQVQSVVGQADGQDQGNQPNAGPKTPEQILQMIRDGQRPVPPGMPPNQQQQPPPE